MSFIQFFFFKLILFLLIFHSKQPYQIFSLDTYNLTSPHVLVWLWHYNAHFGFSFWPFWHLLIIIILNSNTLILTLDTYMTPNTYQTHTKFCLKYPHIYTSGFPSWFDITITFSFQHNLHYIYTKYPMTRHILHLIDPNLLLFV